MATILGSISGLIHDTSAALIDKQIPSKLSTTVTNFVNSGFGIINDVLTIVKDLTEPAPTKNQA